MSWIRRVGRFCFHGESSYRVSEGEIISARGRVCFEGAYTGTLPGGQTPLHDNTPAESRPFSVPEPISQLVDPII